MYNRTTHNIKITVLPQYLEEHSAPEDQHYVWAYTIQLENLGDETVKLLNRHWKITDGNGQLQEVRGAGVIGKQPILNPGEKFEYTSGAALKTPSGIMVGTYQMTSDKGDLFDIDIPAFSLDCPHELKRVN